MKLQLAISIWSQTKKGEKSKEYFDSSCLGNNFLIILFIKPTESPLITTRDQPNTRTLREDMQGAPSGTIIFNQRIHGHCLTVGGFSFCQSINKVVRSFTYFHRSLVVVLPRTFYLFFGHVLKQSKKNRVSTWFSVLNYIVYIVCVFYPLFSNVESTKNALRSWHLFSITVLLWCFHFAMKYLQ